MSSDQIEFADLRALTTVGETGSISKAATRLHLTASAVSQRLLKLERALDQPLLKRHGRGARLTEAGEILVAHSDAILNRLERATAELELQRGSVRGAARIASFPSGVRGLLVKAVAALTESHPELEPSVSELEPVDAIRAVTQGDLDIAVVQDWFDAPLRLPVGLGRTELLDDVADLAVPAGDPLSLRDFVGLEDVVGSDLVTWPPTSGCHAWLIDALSHHGGKRPRIVHTAEEHATLLSMVAAGLGVALLPRLGRETLPPGISIVPVRPLVSRHVYAVWRQDAADRPAIAAMLECLVETADPSDQQDGLPHRIASLESA